MPTANPSSQNSSDQPGDRSDRNSLINALVVEDSLSEATRLLQILSKTAGATFCFECVDRVEVGIRRIGKQPFDVVLLDLMLPDTQGLESFLRLYASHPDVPIVVLTGVDDERLAAEALRRDAQDYLVKGSLSDDMVVRSLRYAVERNRRQQAERHVLRAQREERRRLARELHDGVVQSLSAMRLQLQMLGAELNTSEGPIADAIQMLEAETLTAIDDVRRVSHDLHPSGLERRELVAALAWYCDYLGNRSGVEIKLSNQCRQPVSDHTKEHLFRIVQECLRNGVKHAGASRLQVTIQCHKYAITVEVRDDGKGFNVEAAESASGGLGLISIRERAMLLGGTARIESQPGAGTTISVEVPV